MVSKVQGDPLALGYHRVAFLPFLFKLGNWQSELSMVFVEDDIYIIRLDISEINRVNMTELQAVDYRSNQTKIN